MSTLSRRSHTATAVAAALLPALALPLWLSPALAADNELEEVTVLGSLEQTLPQELAKLGNELSVISDKQLRDGGYRDVAQALERTTPGLYLNPYEGPFGYTDISLQGSRRNDVLWVMDGVRINNRLYSTTPPNDTMPSAPG